MKAGFISLGCAKNLVDTEVMLGILQDNGIELTPDPAEAEIIIVNTCAFIQSAKEESITTVLNMAEYKETGCCRSLIIAGCLGERYHQELLDDMPEADAIIGTGAWNRIMEAVRETLAGNRIVLAGENEIVYDAKTPRILTTPVYTAYVKIAVEGVREIILVAQDSTYYGKDIYGEPSLARLLQELVKIEKVAWLRVLYCYPKNFTDELITTIAQEPKICKYVDLPLQHAHNSILKSMRRPDTQEEVVTLLEKIRKRIPNVAVRSTFIVGFPGETDAQYQTLRRFLIEQRFEKVGIFTYSQEEDTPAASMPRQVPEDVVQERYHDLMSVQCKISEELNQGLEGKELDVLVEGRDEEQPNLAFGRSYREAPGVDGQIFIEGDAASRPGDIVRVRIVQGFTYDAVGELVE